MALRTRRSPCVLWIMALGLSCLAGHADFAQAQSNRINAKVVWLRGDRIYLAATDSIALEPGTLLTFSNRGSQVAAGVITAVYDGDLIAARLTSGSLKKVKKPERLEVASEHPALQAAPLLRIGYPAQSRTNLIFACPRETLHAPAPYPAYRTEVTSEHSYRLVRDSSFVDRVPWPDTLLLRLFDEVADEEIALERGELDVAVFWPGEASSHIREVMHWRGSPSGTRDRGFVAAAAIGPEASRDPIVIGGSERRSFALLNQELFRGDLSPCAGAPLATAQTNLADSLSMPGMTRFEVDSSCPGRQVLERILNREVRSVATAYAPLRVRVSYVDASIRDSGDSSATTCLFIVRCPIISAPDLRRYLDALGADALANLFECEPAGRRP